jgi:hypothetical protein
MWLGYSLSFWQSVFFCATITTAVAGGISITSAFISAIVGYQISDISQSEADQRIADANARGEEARAEAAQANERAAMAEERSAEANLELARMKAPRALTAEQQNRITEKIMPFAGKQFDVAIPPGDPEPFMLMEVIEAAVRAANWVQRDWIDKVLGALKLIRSGRAEVGNVSAIGVLIEVDQSRLTELKEAAETLASALNDEGIPALATVGTATKAANADAIHILIGKKF